MSFSVNENEKKFKTKVISNEPSVSGLEDTYVTLTSIRADISVRTIQIILVITEH